MTDKEMEARKERAKREAELSLLKPITFDEYDAIVKKWMLLADTGITKLLPAIIIANKIMGRDPLWVYLIGPSGGGKTEILSMASDWGDVYEISSVTEKTFLSGMPGMVNPGLLYELDGKIMAFADWTHMASGNKEEMAAIMGQLRDIYGGHVVKAFGNGKKADWRGKVGMIACTTSEGVEGQQQRNAPLGERFVHYRIRMANDALSTDRALENGPKMAEMRKELKDAFFAFMKGIEMPKKPMAVPDAVQAEIKRLSRFATLSRSGVIREWGMKQEILRVPKPERSARLAQQLLTLATAVIIVNGNFYKEEDMGIIYQVALDSIPEIRYRLMAEMARGDERTTKEIATSDAVRLPTATVRRHLEELEALRLASRVDGKDSEGGGTADKWTLMPEYVEILKKYEDIQPVPKDEIKVEGMFDGMPALESEMPVAQEKLV